MAKRSNSENPHDVVLFTAFDNDGKVVLEEVVSLWNYYEESHPIIDDSNFISRRSIRVVNGKLFNDKGVLDQHFTNEYDEKGKIRRSRVVFSDGTISEDEFEMT